MPAIGKAPERDAEQRVEDAERGAEEEADIAVAQPEIALDVLREDRKDLAIDEIEDIDEEQDGQDMPGIGIDRPFVGRKDSRPGPP